MNDIIKLCDERIEELRIRGKNIKINALNRIQIGER